MAHMLLASGLKASANSDDNTAILFSSVDPETRHRSVVLTDMRGQSQRQLAHITNDDGYPAMSPDGKFFAFYGKYDDKKTWSIHSAPVDGSAVTRLTHAKNTWDSAPAWSADGKTILFSREYRDDSDQWHEEIWTMSANGKNQSRVTSLAGGGASFLADGRILFHTQTGPSDIAIASSDGSRVVQLTQNTHEDIFPAISPDGTRIAFMSDRDGNREIYVMDVDGSNQTRLTFNEVEDWNPAWSPDGDKILFASGNDAGLYDIYWMKSDGTEITSVAVNGIQPSWATRPD